ncbi:MAG: hypothetical protein KTR26_02380 [Flammeovirgaceae bacterium]|nr:hypothetical protein [Flammeovirgaceae bacterium]
MLTKLRLLILVLVMGFVTNAFGQGGNSPFSILGIGELVDKGNVRSVGMGGVGISSPHPLSGNIINPANLTYNQFTFFDLSLYTEYREVKSTNVSQTDVGGNIYNISFGFPVNKNWGMAFGLRPVSAVNSKVSAINKIDGSGKFAKYEYFGDGGINQVYWSNGVSLFKGFSVGLEASLNFGSINKQTRSTIEDNADVTNYQINFYDRTTFSEFVFVPGISYSGKIGEKSIIRFGAVYQGTKEFGVKKLETMERLIPGSDDKVSVDTLRLNTEGNVTLPSDLKLGLTFEKEFNYLVSVDVAFQRWSDYKDFEGRQGLLDARTLRIGGEWVPDYTSISSYLKRMTYRAGFAYKELPYLVNDNQLLDVSARFGLALPMNRGLSSIDMAFEYGRTQLNNQEFIKESYIRFYLGVTINDRWFIRRTFN